jgi:hypothetical protein
LEESTQKPLRVVDRRHFTAEGERREADGQPASVQPAPPEPSPQEPPAEREAAESPLFKELVMQLATSCMLSLGQIPNPLTGRAEVDLGSAGIGIDMLSVLQEKTRRNLAPAEADLLNDLLSQLRLGYYQASQKGGGA